jgi:hypothetical protein
MGARRVMGQEAGRDAATSQVLARTAARPDGVVIPSEARNLVLGAANVDVGGLHVVPHHPGFFAPSGRSE